MVKRQPIPISAAARIAQEYGYEQVVVIGRRWSDDASEHCTTYGVDKANCAVAARMGEVLQRAMNWPEQHPAPQQPAITDAMVERGLAEYKRMGFVYDLRQGIRNILTAALNAAQEGK